MNEFINTLQTIYQLKKIERTGWIKNKVQHPETIAAHSFGAAMLAMLFAKQCQLDENRCIKMALVHDVQESIVGDYTPYCDITEEQKHQKELTAAQLLSNGLNNVEYLELFNEFEENQTQEAKFVHDCDKLDMLLQAFFYEEDQKIDLSSFFENCKLPASFKQLVDVRNELEKKRKE